MFLAKFPYYGSPVSDVVKLAIPDTTSDLSLPPVKAPPPGVAVGDRRNEANMTRPAVWQNDPACSHEVACAFQTHYCTYIRVPRLLTLQSRETPAELLLVTTYQWYELWFKVLVVDMNAALQADVKTFEPVKLLRRGIELFNLFQLQADLAGSSIAPENELTAHIRAASAAPASGQFSRLEALSGHLESLENSFPPALAAAAREYCSRFQSFRSHFQKFLNDTLIIEPDRAPTYDEWLNLSELLALQNGVKAAWTEEGREPAGYWQPEKITPDENMFIVVHQCFELWFQVILEQLDRAITALFRGDVAAAMPLIRRVALLQRLLVSQIQIPATMQPLDFMRFRNQSRHVGGSRLTTGLSPASGTESYQFREIEIVSGLRDDATFQKYLHGTDKLPIRLLTPRQSDRMKQPTLPEAFRHAVAQRGLTCLDQLFMTSDRQNPNADLVELADLLIQFDEFFWLWRINHVSMVQKMIGAQSGTGFLGPEYLMETAGIKLQEENRVFEERQVRPRFFEELWAARTRQGHY